MKRLSFYFLSLFVFVSCLFCFSPNVYASEVKKSSSFGDKIPAFPSDVKNYDYIIIRLSPSSNSYELLCLTPNTSKRPYVCYDTFSSGSVVYPVSIVYPNCSAVSYQWSPLESDIWVRNWINPSFNVHQNWSSIELFRSCFLYINSNIYDEDGKIFFIKTPLMNFTIMQSSISALLQRIFPPLITIIIPSCLVLLGVLVISLVLLPKLFKVFLKT